MDGINRAVYGPGLKSTLLGGGSGDPLHPLSLFVVSEMIRKVF